VGWGGGAQLESELEKDRQEALKATLAEEAARLEEKRLKERERERERERMELEKAAMLEQLRLFQEKQDACATRLQGVYRAHMTRKHVEMPAQKRARLSVVLQMAWRCHAARVEQRRRVTMLRQAAVGRKKVQAVSCIQRVYRGHMGRVVHAEALAERAKMKPQIDAVNVLKGFVLCSLYRTAYRAVMHELEARARQFAAGELPEVAGEQGLWAGGAGEEDLGHDEGEREVIESPHEVDPRAAGVFPSTAATDRTEVRGCGARRV
jgi:hypothetical protein